MGFVIFALSLRQVVKTMHSVKLNTTESCALIMQQCIFQSFINFQGLQQDINIQIVPSSVIMLCNSSQGGYKSCRSSSLKSKGLEKTVRVERQQMIE